MDLSFPKMQMFRGKELKAQTQTGIHIKSQGQRYQTDSPKLTTNHFEGHPFVVTQGHRFSPVSSFLCLTSPEGVPSCAVNCPLQSCPDDNVTSQQYLPLSILGAGLPTLPLTLQGVWGRIPLTWQVLFQILEKELPFGFSEEWSGDHFQIFIYGFHV